MAGLALYETALRDDWLDYNGHLRDASYALIASLASDALMDRVGLDAQYRQASGATLYTLEMHLHYLSEVKSGDHVRVDVRVIGVDRKRIHAGFELYSQRASQVAATAELMLLHVAQHQGKARSTPFPPEVAARLAELQAQTAGLVGAGPGSRALALPAYRDSRS